MGACVSVHRSSDAAMKAQLSFESKPDKIVIPSPVKEKPISNGDVALKSQWPSAHSPTSVRDFGSKEETFFDSQAWLESDCEDDFMSVRGDFTPSRGSTPVHHNFSAGTPRVSGALSVDRIPISITAPHQREKKIKLSDLFKDSLRNNVDFDEETTLENQNEKIETNGTPYASGANSACSSELTPNRDFKPHKMRSARSVQRCFPSLLSLSSCSSGEKKKKMSPGHVIG